MIILTAVAYFCYLYTLYFSYVPIILCIIWLRDELGRGQPCVETAKIGLA